MFSTIGSAVVGYHYFPSSASLHLAGISVSARSTSSQTTKIYNTPILVSVPAIASSRFSKKPKNRKKAYTSNDWTLLTQDVNAGLDLDHLGRGEKLTVQAISRVEDSTMMQYTSSDISVVQGMRVTPGFVLATSDIFSFETLTTNEQRKATHMSFSNNHVTFYVTSFQFTTGNFIGSTDLSEAKKPISKAEIVGDMTTESDSSDTEGEQKKMFTEVATSEVVLARFTQSIGKSFAVSTIVQSEDPFQTNVNEVILRRINAVLILV